MSTAGRIVMKIRRNWYWGRTHGWANLIEEHDLDPRVRIPRAARRTVWLARHGSSTCPTRPIFLVGAQRSGTNMITHGLDQAPEFEVFNEGNGKAFSDYQLRELPVIDDLVDGCRRPFALFKPLCDSDRTADLLDHTEHALPARAIWAYRDMEGRVRSHVLKFRSSNLDAFRDLVDDPGRRSWQTRGLSDDEVDLVRRLDPGSMTPETASALFWYLRNDQYFEGGLDQRSDVLLADYGSFLVDPEHSMRRLCRFLEFPYRPELVAHIAPQQPKIRVPIDIDPTVRDLCRGLEERLAEARGRQDARLDALGESA